MPIAGDESNYLRWAEIVVNQRQWFISLLDGKQPLTTWLLALALALSPRDPLTAARWLSALAGAASTLGIFAVARRLSGEIAGLVAAGLYAFLPYALLYDRLTYTEAFVNLAGVAIVYASVASLGPSAAPWWKGSLWLGMALGLGFLVKSTALLFWFFPAAAALWLRPARVVARLGMAYSVALLFPILSWMAMPQAPTMQTHSLLVHQTSFFVDPRELLRHPFAAAGTNLRLIADYVAAYMTVPLALAGLAALFYLVRRRNIAAAVIASVSVAPLLVQIFVLHKIFPTRYPFPHMWPWLVLIGMAAASLPRRLALGITCLVALPVVGKGLGVVARPEQYLYLEDVRTFLGSGPAAGWGIREAAEFLRSEARRGPITVLTDPIWGPPADSIFVYCNGRDGITVYEAWWTSIAPDHPILPPAPVELVKSQYERVPAGLLDPRLLDRVYYVTETQYYPRSAVQLRQPNARHVVSFPKPNGRNSIDIYRLR